MLTKSERFEMRLDQGTLNKVDEWRERQDDHPSRAEAIRRLVEAGMERYAENPVRLTDGERLIVHALCEVYKHLKIKGGIDPAFVEAALHGGHNWGLRWKYPGIYHGHEDSQRVVDEVLQVLDMWDTVENSYDKLGKKDKDRIVKEAEPFGKRVYFPGFDGNNESAYVSVAGFLINDLERFSTLKGRNLNSQLPSVDTYRRMYRVFEPMRRKLMGGGLSAAQIIEILREMVHPDNRKS